MTEKPDGISLEGSVYGGCPPVPATLHLSSELGTWTLSDGSQGALHGGLLEGEPSQWHHPLTVNASDFHPKPTSFMALWPPSSGIQKG